jgi:hypothetical protein
MFNLIAISIILRRSFRPDLILLRQSVRGLGLKEDWRSLLFGMKYGNIPSINSLESVFNFLEKPWVVSNILAHVDAVY